MPFLSWRLAALCLIVGAARGQARRPSTPTSPLRIMVGAIAGGGTDIIARMLADKFGAAFKQPFVVENRPGASNTIAADLTAKAPRPTATRCWSPPTPARRSRRT